MYYSKSNKGFYNPIIHDTMPADAKPLSDADYQALLDGALEGKQIEWSGPKPKLVDPTVPVLTNPQIEEARKRAYADPVTGSDRHFSEAARMQTMGESDWQAQRDAGIARYEEIQSQYPWAV